MVEKVRSGKGVTGMLMVIDEERGTLGQYAMKLKEDTPCDTPCCYFYRC